MTDSIWTAIIAGFSTLTVGVVLWYLGRASSRSDRNENLARSAVAEQSKLEQKRYEASVKESTDIRQELRQEVKELKEQQCKMQAEIDEWRDKYYDLIQKYNEVMAENVHLASEIEILKEKFNCQ